MKIGLLKKIWLFAYALLVGIALIPAQLVAADAETTGNLWDGETYLGRAYDENFDRMFDDFQRTEVSTIPVGSDLDNITITGDVSFDGNVPYYHTNYNSTTGVTAPGAIYKAAGRVNEGGKVKDYIVMDIRGSNGAQLSDIQVLFRRSDVQKSYPVSIADLLDPEGEKIELTFDGTFQRIIFDPFLTLEDCYFAPGSGDEIGIGEAADDIIGDRLVGIHIINANASGAGTIDIKDPFWSSEANVADSEHGGSTNFPLVHDYWGGSVGTLIEQWLIVGEGAYLSYAKADKGNSDEAYDAFVVSVKGDNVDSSKISIAPYYVDGTKGTAIAFDALKGPDELVIPEISDSFTNFAIGLSANGFEKDVLGFEIINSDSATIYISEVFFTNVEILPPAGAYPILDADTALMFDDFSRETVGVTLDYDINNPVALANDFTYLIAYAGTSGLAMQEGALALSQGTGAFQDYHVRSDIKFADNSYQYLVLKTKLTNGASYDQFRFQNKTAADGNSSILYMNDALAAPGLSSIPENLDEYVYQSNGWTYLVVDMQLSSLGAECYGFTIYYSGAGAVLIDSIFFANANALGTQEEDSFDVEDFERTNILELPNSLWWNATYDSAAVIVDGELQLGGDFGQYRFAPKNTGWRYLQFDIKAADDTSTLEDFRIGDASTNGFSYFKDGKLLDPNGFKIPQVTTDYVTVTVDLEASGIPLNEAMTFMTEGGNQLLIDNVKLIREFRHVWDSEFSVDDFNRDADQIGVAPDSMWWNATYGSAATIVDGQLQLGSDFGQYRFAPKVVGVRYIQFDIKAANETSTLDYFRMGDADTSAIVWWNSGNLVNEFGNPLPQITHEYYMTITVDLWASGIPLNEAMTLMSSDGHQLLIDNIKLYASNEHDVNPLDVFTTPNPSGTLKVGVDTVAVGSTWVDAGVDTKNNVTVNGTVDTTTAGTYTVTYVIDNGVGVELELVRVVTVVASKDSVTFELNAGIDTIVKGGTWTDGGVSVKVNGQSSTATVSVSGAVDTTTANSYKVTYTVTVGGVAYTYHRIVTVVE